MGRTVRDESKRHGFIENDKSFLTQARSLSRNLHRHESILRTRCSRMPLIFGLACSARSANRSASCSYSLPGLTGVYGAISLFELLCCDPLSQRCNRQSRSLLTFFYIFFGLISH
jgi:hypothetical protein